MSDTAAATATMAQATAVPARSWFWKDPSGFSFHDLIDVINPLQHLPVIGTVYRWLTGDEPGNVSRVVGDGIYGGPIGAGVSLFNVVTEDKQGRDLGEQTLTAMFGPGHDRGETAVAAAKPAAIPSQLVHNADGAVDLSAGSAWTRPAPAMVAEAAPKPTRLTPTAPLPAALAAASAAAPPAKPDHAAIPLVAAGPPKALFGGIATPVPAPATAPSGPQGDPAQAFLAKAATLQREAAGPKNSAQVTAPVPLVMPPGSLPQRPAALAGASQAPADVSQKMLDALDKYMKLQQKKEVTPAEAPAAAAVDLTL